VVEILRLPALLFGAAARLRGFLYARRLLRIRRLDTPVVSVGNLSSGGTGKTPAVVWIARVLIAAQGRPGILSRGYRRRAGESSDEARLLARLLPGVPHVENPDRVAGGSRLEELGVDAILLDDGFQHRALARDLDIVLVDATRPWGLPPPPGGGAPVCALLPRGLLREPPRALARADALVLTRCEAVPGEVLGALRRELEELAPGRPLALARHAPSGLRTLGGEARELAELRGREVDLVSGIGNPEAFQATVAELGAEVAAHRVFDDHHHFQPGDFEGLGTRACLVTAKDAVKLEGIAPPETLVLDVELAFLEGEDALRELLAGLPEGIRRRERAALHEGLHG